MSIIAITDTLFLLQRFESWFANSFSDDFRTIIGCKLKIFAIHWVSTFGAYEIVLMTLDKVIAITIPHKAKSICTPKRAKLLSFLMFMILFVLNVPQFMFTSLIAGTKQCARYVVTAWYVTAYSYLYILLFPIVPVVLLFVMNTVIIRTVWKRRQLHSNTSERSNSSESQLTAMLVLVSLVFVVFLLPFETRAIYYYLAGKPATPEQYAVYFFLFHVTAALYLLNHCINFFLYLISGSKFRNDIRTLLGKKLSRNDVSQFGSTSVESRDVRSNKYSGDWPTTIWVCG